MNKVFNILFIYILLFSASYALTLDDLTEPKPPMGRISNSERVESKTETVQKKEEVKVQLLPQKNSEEVVENNEQTESKEEKTVQKKETNEINASYADLSLKRLASDISYELELDSAKTNSDLNILWAAATERSETMKYTIYKLSNPDEDKPNESVMKKILRPIANASSVVGASVSSDPYLATGAIIGGGLINAFMKDDKEINYKFSKVSDADMVLLVRKIDELQKKLLELYSDYKTKEKLANMAKENLDKRELIYKKSQNKPREELVIADVYYRSAKTNYLRAQDELTIARAVLENLVGTDALEKIEQ